METLMYFMPLLIWVVVIVVVVYFSKKGRSNNKVNGSGKMSEGAIWSPNAQIVDIQTDSKVTMRYDGMKTVVLFSDGYIYTTYYCKKETKMKLGGASYRYYVDAEAKQKIITAATIAHSQSH